jgi:hypothetical protein
MERGSRCHGVFQDLDPSRRDLVLMGHRDLSITVSDKRANRVPPPSAFKRSSERRRALTMLANPAANGCTEAMMLAHGFWTEMMVELIRDGLATAQTERMLAGKRAIEVARVRITDAGRRALAERAK